MKKFKNKSDRDLIIPDVGIVKAGEIVELPDGFHNANFEPVKAERPKAVEEKKSKVKDDEQ